MFLLSMQNSKALAVESHCHRTENRNIRRRGEDAFDMLWGVFEASLDEAQPSLIDLTQWKRADHTLLA